MIAEILKKYMALSTNQSIIFHNRIMRNNVGGKRGNFYHFPWKHFSFTMIQNNRFIILETIQNHRTYAPFITTSQYLILQNPLQNAYKKIICDININVNRAGIKPIGQITPPCWSYLLLAVQVHTTTHCRFYKEQQMGPSPPKAGPAF
jgi:hypothetical protein